MYLKQWELVVLTMTGCDEAQVNEVVQLHVTGHYHFGPRSQTNKMKLDLSSYSTESFSSEPAT